MKAPTYTAASGSQGLACSQCGSIVGDQDKHTSWHAALARILGLEVDE